MTHDEIDQTIRADTEIQLAVFKVGEETYGIDIMKIKEVIKPLKTTPLPDVPEFVKGVINLRGLLMPLISMRDRFGLPVEENEGESKIIIVSLSKLIVGILVDRVEDIVSIPLKNIQPPPKIASGIDSKYIKGICKIGEDVLVLVNLEKILTSVDQVMIKDLNPSGNVEGIN